MTPHEQANKLVADYYEKTTGSPMGENVNQEALRQAIERAKARARSVLNYYLDQTYDNGSYNWHSKILYKLNEM